MANREDRFQMYAHSHILPMLPPDTLLHSIPNEHKCKPARGAKLNAMGRKKGVADWLIIHAGRPIYIEFKCAKDAKGPKTYQHKNQKEFERNAIASGAAYHVVRTFDELCDVLRSYQIPLKGRVSV